MRHRLAPAGLALLLALAACGNPVAEGARLRATVVGSGQLAARLEAEATRPTLIAHDGAGQLVPGLATSWRFVDDGRSLILRLAPAQWSDASRLESKEVVAAMRRAATTGEPALAAAGIRAAADIAAGKAPATRLGVLAPIARVVEIRLVAASPLLLGWLADPALAVVRAPRPGKAPAAPASLAAYTAAGPADRRRLTRRAMAALPEALPAEITIAGTPDATAAIAAFGRGETDLVLGEGLAGLGEARGLARRDTLRLDSAWGVYGYVANTRTGPLADARVRLALTLAIDRPGLVDRFGIPAMAPVEGLLPPSLAVGTPIAANLDPAARITLAQQLMASAGHAADAQLQLTLALPPGRDHRVVAEQVAAGWARIGIRLVIVEGAPAIAAAQLRRGTVDLALTETSLAVPDAAALLSRWRCRKPAPCNPVVDALLDEAAVAGPAVRAERLARAEAVLMEAPPMIPLFTPVRWALVAPRVSGWVPNPTGIHPLARLSVGDRR